LIPALPLALDRNRKFDEAHQRALIRYYLAAGADGLAVGVSTTQYAIRARGVGLYGPRLELAAETMAALPLGARPAPVRIAGVQGATNQTVEQARVAAGFGYDAALISLDALSKASADQIIADTRAVSEILPVIAFDAKPSRSPRSFEISFWRRLLEIENLVGLNIQAGDNCQTLDAVRAAAESGRAEIALHASGGDNLIAGLLTPFVFDKMGSPARLNGVLGGWSFGTRSAARHVLECQRIVVHQKLPVPQRMLALSAQLSDTCAAVLDAAHDFAGCVPGIHEVLRRQGLLASALCLDPNEVLSPGQSEEIDRVQAAYPHLSDDSFVAEHLGYWLT
jgi:dihydrodipicolinate synthase/N-acetylneuraminate lyase